MQYLCNICTIFVQRPVHPQCRILCNICAIFVQYFEIFLQYTCNICGQTLSGSPLGDNLSEARASASLMKTTAIWLFASIALTAMYLLFDIYSTISFCFWVKSLRESYAPSFMHPKIICIHCQAYYPWSMLSTSPFVACATLCNLYINCTFILQLFTFGCYCIHLHIFPFVANHCIRESVACIALIARTAIGKTLPQSNIKGVSKNCVFFPKRYRDFWRC